MRSANLRTRIFKQPLAGLGIVFLFLTACLPTDTVFPTYTPTSPALAGPTRALASKTASVPPTANHTSTPTIKTPTFYPGWISYPEFRFIRDMVFDQEGRLWAAGPDGVVLLQPDGTQYRFTMKDGLPSNDVLSVGLDSHGVLWFGTRGGGVASFNGKDWQTFTTVEGLAGNEVFSIDSYVGYDGVLFGTQNGLSVYTGSWANFSGTSYLPDDEVHAIAVFPDGSIWVGTRNGVTLFGPSETYTTANGLASDMVHAMAIAPDCDLWLATDQGASQYDAETWTSYTIVNGLVADEVPTLAVTLDNVVWFGTQAGVSRFDGHTWTTYTTADGLANNDVLSIAVAPDDTLWFGTAGGISQYSPSIELLSGEMGMIPQGFSGTISALKVVYLKDGHLWLWNAGMRNMLTREGRISSFKLSGDGRMVAFTRLNNGLENELWVINQDGNDERLLVSPDELSTLANSTDNEWAVEKPPQVVFFQYEWIPGQNLIAYNTRRHLEEAGTSVYDDLYLVEAATGQNTTLLPPGSGGKFSFSPDGTQVAIVTPNEISIMNADGSHWRRNLLEYPSIMTYSEAPYYPHIFWSIDSQFLRLALPPKDPLGTPPQPTMLWQVQADGSPAIHLGNLPPIGLFAFSVAFSPDLERLAYLSSTDDLAENQREFHIANVDGSGDHVVLKGLKINFQNWSQDGEHFIYSFGDPKSWYIGSINGVSTPLNIHPENLAWINNDSFLHIENLGCSQELRLTNLDGESLMIDRMWKPPASFDFTYGKGNPSR